MLLVLLVVVVLNFLMLHLAPGDIADTIAQTMGGADEQDMAELRKQYGLDQPFFIQLFNYVVRVALLDFYILPNCKLRGVCDRRFSRHNFINFSFCFFSFAILFFI